MHPFLLITVWGSITLNGNHYRQKGFSSCWINLWKKNSLWMCFGLILTTLRIISILNLTLLGSRTLINLLSKQIVLIKDSQSLLTPTLKWTLVSLCMSEVFSKRLEQTHQDTIFMELSSGLRKMMEHSLETAGPKIVFGLTSWTPKLRNSGKVFISMKTSKGQRIFSTSGLIWMNLQYLAGMSCQWIKMLCISYQMEN